MTKLYIILSIVGWAWLMVAAIFVPIRLRRLRDDRSAMKAETILNEPEQRVS